MRFILLVLFALISIPAQALEITGLSVETKDNNEHVSLGLNAEVKARVFLVDGAQPRVVVDVPVARWDGRVGLPEHYRGSMIKRVRFGFHDARTSRLVFDLATNVTLQNTELVRAKKTGHYLLEFDLVGSSSRQKKPVMSETLPAKIADKPTIVIDAGHGGQDPGTSGYNGTQEKEITLHYAYALRDALLKTGRYHVALTRDDDRYLLLRDRVKRARKAKGDLFISLHADSAPTRYARGLSVYTISEKASDKEAEQLAAKENKADVIGGMDLSSASKDVADILIDLAGRETRAKSAKFADLAVRYLGREVHLLSNTHRFAGFAVLKAPDIPSVLIEIGFLTTPREEHLLKSTAYQAKVVHAVVKAIDSYFGKNKK
jgi:N-acetylmuramoyl-L-alanine amidase